MSYDLAGMQCLMCARFRSPLDNGGPERHCTAFTGKIPDEIWGMEFDHRKPYRGDHGEQWVAQGEGFEYPEAVLKMGQKGK